MGSPTPCDGDPPWGHPKTLNKAKEGPKEAPNNPKDGHKQSPPRANRGDHHYPW